MRLARAALHYFEEPCFCPPVRKGGYPARENAAPAHANRYPVREDGYPAQQDGFPSREDAAPVCTNGSSAQPGEYPAREGESGSSPSPRASAGSASASSSPVRASEVLPPLPGERPDDVPTVPVGAIFFTGCALRCVYCQNKEIWDGRQQGRTVTPERLREICFALKEAGARAIDLVTPSHYAPLVREALLPIRERLALPIIANTGGYETPRQVDLLADIADIFLPDYKYSDPALAALYSGAPDYPRVAERAIEQMVERTGPPIFAADGTLSRGTLVRHLVLPGHRRESIAAVRRLRALFSPGDILLSLLAQYTPFEGAPPPLNRPLTTFEYESVREEAVRCGFSGYGQSRGSASRAYTPPFDLTGVL